MDEEHLIELKKLALIALFSDEELMSRLVLKGGNVLDIVYNVAFRSSIDLDFSMEGDFDPSERAEIEMRIRNVLDQGFKKHGYVVFDMEFVERPPEVTEDMKEFWGGYQIKFKLIEAEKYMKLKGEARDLRVRAMDLGPGHRKSFKIDISKFEYCQPKRPREVDGSTVYVYSPEMLVLEKLRAICQQMPEYREKVRNPSQSARARDFFDIHTILTTFRIDLLARESVDLMKCIFAAKRVPIELIFRIPNYREYHREDFDSVRDTVRPQHELADFDFYFDFVVENCCKPLESMGNK